MTDTQLNTPTRQRGVARRAKGEQTRLHILQSARTVISKNGIKGTTHRAVAAEADIQLSLTTYYFKDIKELVREAFILSSKESIENNDLVWESVFQHLTKYTKMELRKVNARKALRDELVSIASEFLYEQIVFKPVGLAVEQVFLTEARFSPELRELAEEYREALMTPAVKFCAFFNKQTAEIDAQILMTLITQIEYQQLLLPTEEVNIETLQALLSRCLGWVMGLQQA